MELERTELQAQVLQSLREGPKTVRQLSSALSERERLVRGAVDSLAAERYIFPAGWHDRSKLWRINAAVAPVDEYAGRLPYHDIKAGDRSANLLDIVAAGMAKAHELPPVGEVTHGERALVMLYPELAMYLADVAEGKFVDAIEHKHTLLAINKQLTSVTHLLKQILEYKDYWSEEGVAQLSEAPIIAERVELLREQGDYARRLVFGDNEVAEVQ